MLTSQEVDSFAVAAVAAIAAAVAVATVAAVAVVAVDAIVAIAVAVAVVACSVIRVYDHAHSLKHPITTPQVSDAKSSCSRNESLFKKKYFH